MTCNLKSRHLIFALLAILFFGCDKSDQPHKFLVGFSQCNSAEPWREAMNKEMTQEAGKHSEIELIILDAQQDNSKQVSDIENLITREIDLLIVSPNEARPITAVVEKAFDRGIPVIVLDRKVYTEKYTSFIGADNRLIGEAAGKYTIELLGGKGKVVEIWGLRGSTPAIERHEGFRKAISEVEDIEVIYEQDGAWLRRRGREIMENVLQRFSDIDLVYAHNDPMAIGAYLAAQNAQRPGIRFIGIDGLKGTEGGIKAVATGMLDATFVYPTGAALAITTAIKILKNEKVDRNITLQTQLINKSNADENL